MGSLETEFETLVPSLKGATAEKNHPVQYSLVQICKNALYAVETRMCVASGMTLREFKEYNVGKC